MIEAIKKRRSIRSFQDKAVEKEKLSKILMAGMFSPSAMHLRPWHFIVVTEKATRKKLGQSTEYSSFLAKAPLNIVVCSKDVKRWIEDCSIAAVLMQLQAVQLGLASCWVQIRGKNDSLLRRTLNIPDDIHIECVLAIGYPAEEKPEHSETEFEEEKVHKEKW